MARRTHFLEDDELARVLSLPALNLPDKPKVVDIKFNDYEDWTGEESLEVWVIIADETRDEELKYPAIGQILEAIQGALDDAHESRFAYVRFGTREGYERRYSYDTESDE